MSASRRRPPPPIVRRWEGLHVATQIAIVFPIAVVVLWGVHIWLLNQPLLRGFGYGVFWGVLATAAIVGATRSERARREREEPPTRRGPGSP